MARHVLRTLIASGALAMACRCTIAEPPEPAFEIGVTVPTTQLDPARGDGPGTVLVAALAFETLPQLAVRTTRAADGATWTFELPRGRSFADGTSLDAVAVAANFTRWSARDASGAAFPVYAKTFGAHAGARRIVAFRAIDATHFVVRSCGRTGDLPEALRDRHYAIASPAAFATGGAGDRAPAGSGPYRVVSFVRGSAVTLVPATRFESRARYASVVIRDVPDPHTSILSLEKHDLAAVYGLPERFVPEAYAESMNPLREESTGRSCAFAVGLVKAERACPPSASLVAAHDEPHPP